MASLGPLAFLEDEDGPSMVVVKTEEIPDIRFPCVEADTVLEITNDEDDAEEEDDSYVIVINIDDLGYEQGKNGDPDGTQPVGSSSSYALQTFPEVKYPYQCDMCPESFMRLSYLEHHINMKHSEEATPSKHRRNENNENEDKPLPYHCKVCNKGFKSKSGLLNHSYSHSGKEYACDVCHKKYASPRDMKVHRKNHFRDKKFKCDICGLKWYMECQLKVHMKVAHTDEKPYKCELCGKRFSQKGGLTTHSLLHSDVKPFKCSYCPMTFRHNASLTIHEMKHKGSKPFACDKCDKRFYTHSNLIAHQTVHSEVKQFKCDLCDSSYRQRASLRRHKIEKHAIIARDQDLVDYYGNFEDSVL